MKTKSNPLTSFLREQVLPKGMSVTEAAKLLGIGRPALSNLLNGNAALSNQMSIRLEKTFGVDRNKLLDLQASSLRNETRLPEESSAAVRTYVPRFLIIKASHIEEWARSNIHARQQLPVLLRKLIHSTARGLNRVDFPGYDNAERHGADGAVEAIEATPWIPEGKSIWEFGTTQNPSVKAEHDYASRTASIPASERHETTFVFVTPRNWPGKNEWAKNKNAAKNWRSVRTLDASDLEQWLEESISGQMWLSEVMGVSAAGCETLEKCWDRWANASEPALSAEIFALPIKGHISRFKEWLEKPSERPFIVAADSRDEALAFLACLFRNDDIFPRWGDLPAVFHGADVLRRVAPSSSPFIAVASTEEAERELISLYRKTHCITVRPRNAVSSEPDVALDLLTSEAFKSALETMSISDPDVVDRLEKESGRSPTILRRRLSKIDAIRKPVWAANAQAARSLFPLALVGAWHAKSKGDCEVLATLAGISYDQVEKNLAELLLFDDSPVWSEGQYRGVASKIDSLFAVSALTTERDLTAFFLIAEYVLSERDPALDLPEDRRWTAGVYGKVRDHSAALRKGLCETLVILAAHGNNLFQNRLGMDVVANVSALVNRLLTPLTLEKLLSQDSDLPHYAEAAPDKFLRLLEDDLSAPESVVLGLLKPASTGIFGTCPRTGLLWALECLAWNPKNLLRVSKILARLSRTRIDDNWANTPIASLEAIYRSWMPQTAAGLEDRKRALDALAKSFPDIAWQICVAQFESGPQWGHPSYRPRWRSDASGAGQPGTYADAYAFNRHALDLTLGWAEHDHNTLGDLVERLGCMIDEDQVKVWDLIDTWSSAESRESAKAELRERIRRFAFTRRGKKRDLAGSRNRAEEAYAKLESSDPVIRHKWLFANQWVEPSAAQDEEDVDYYKTHERVHNLRLNAMRDICATPTPLIAVDSLLFDSGADQTVGQYTALSVTEPQARISFIRHYVSISGQHEKKADGFMQGFLAAMEPEQREPILSHVAENSEKSTIARLYRCAPFDNNTWYALAKYGMETQTEYWKTVFPHWNRHNDAELTELIDRLLDVQRPRAAFHAVHMDWERVETLRLKRLLFSAATLNSESPEAFRLSSHDISEALDSLDGRPGITPDDMAQLEFLYIRALSHTEHGIRNIERQLAESPQFFAQAVALAYKRKDGGEDPPEWRIEDEERRGEVAVSIYSLLGRAKRIPGTDRDGKISAAPLLSWVAEVRALCSRYGRAEMGDFCIGQLFSKAPSGERGEWPCEAVCEAIEQIGSRRISEGFYIGERNKRGVHARAPGGTQERDLSAKYRRLAQQISFDFPFAASVLEDIAASYDEEAKWHDSEAEVEKRLRH